MNIASSLSRSSGRNEYCGQPRLKLFVLFTTAPETLLALREAAALVTGLNARIEVIVPEVVAYPLPLDRPPVACSFLLRRYQAIVEQAGIDTDLRICLCRESRSALAAALNPGSVIVIGVRRRWWQRTTQTGLVRWLKEHGHRTVIVGERASTPFSKLLRLFS
jgi:hypothetical protein